MLPKELSLDLFQDKWAFLAVAMVQTKSLRPRGFPEVLGKDFFLIGFRLFVKYVNNRGKRLRGLYILKSETDRWTMQLLGNTFTHYNYSTTDIQISRFKNHDKIVSNKSDINVEIVREGGGFDLPDGSPFDSWKEARRYSGPLPFTFSYDQKHKSMLIIEGVRSNWNPLPISVQTHHFGLINQLNLSGIRLSSAFEIENTAYYWKKGIIEPCK